MILRCRLCHAAIASFDPAALTPPLTGAMFDPLEPGFPPPFNPDTSFDDARCPYCRHHPQGYAANGRDSLETDQGPLVIAQAAGKHAASGKTTKKHSRKGSK